MANVIQPKGITVQSPEGQKYIADFLRVLPTLPPEEQEAVQKLEEKYNGDSKHFQTRFLSWATSYLGSGIMPTTSWDFEDMF